MPSPLYPVLDARRVSRRSFLALSSSLAAASVWSSRACGAVKRYPKLADHPFQIGVASGDPAPDGVVLWTRLAPKPLEGGGMPQEPVEVSWQVADDEGFTKIAREGTTVATPDWAHSVHVEADGLAPDRWYFYRFKVGNDISPVGRTRTTPALDASPANVKFAFASCQHYENGLYTAYEHMLAEHPDLVIHLGDYIYEGPGRENQVRKHVGPEITSVEHYRNRHAQYKTDAALQAMHAAAPWIVTWDDHEVDNNYANSISEIEGVTPEELLERRAHGYQAYYEHMPLRKSSLPQGPNMQLYRRVPYGRLAEFFVLDSRQYRSDQPCGDGNKPQCPEALSEQRTMLGEQQRTWLCDGLADTPSNWKILAQQVMFARVDRKHGEEVGYSMDQWPGYEADRRRLLKCFRERQIANPVVLTGDIHSNWANELIADFDDLDSEPLAAEFVGTSISSGGDGAANPRGVERTLAENPFVKFNNAERGYVVCQLTPDTWRTDYRTVEYVTRPGATLNTRASFILESGDSTLKPA
ncbi:MAG: alkaline phosphatase D family protein [Planctomycetia bacterium]|nr:alkaline phosphatase D family protein [Planctomycetia bacterium]